jgi:hypothetical protein
VLNINARVTSTQVDNGVPPGVDDYPKPVRVGDEQRVRRHGAAVAGRDAGLQYPG